MLEIKGKFGSAREVFKVIRAVSELEIEDSNVSLPTPAFKVVPSKPSNSLTNYSLEAELKKAEALTYLCMFDHPDETVNRKHTIYPRFL